MHRSKPTSNPNTTLKHRVLTCLTKLSDRDTHSLAVTELHAIVRTLDQRTLPLFLSCILHTTDPTDTTPLRKQCLRLLTTLSESHGNALSPYLPKILTNLVRRFRDPDSSVRTACTDSVRSLSVHVRCQSFSVFLRPLSEALFTEQEPNAQAAAAACLSSAVEASPDPDSARLAKLLPRLQKLLKLDGFKAKAAVLQLIRSIVGAGGASGAVSGLVPCLLEAIGSTNWAARKAAAEVLEKLAEVERNSLSEFKAGCLKVIENRRFDKVKLVREAMNRTIEAWKQVPDVSDEFSPPPHSQYSSKENVSSECYPQVSQNSCSPGSVMTRFRRISASVSRSTPPDRSSAINAKKTSTLSSTKRMSSSVSRKLNNKNWDVQVVVSSDPFNSRVDQGDLQQRDEVVLERSRKDEKGRFFKSEIRRGLFENNSDDKKMHKYSGSKAGSRVVPFSEDSQDSEPGGNVTKDLHKSDKQNEDLSLIRSQLLQIEKQQSSLLDLLQNFIGRSESGMRSLETRVQGLEFALDEISYDLAVSSGRMSKPGAPKYACCLLPGSEILSAKFWKRTQSRYSSSQLSRSDGTQLLAAVPHRDDMNAETELRSHRLRLHSDGGSFITNPLAEINTNSKKISGFARAEPN
ncbi:hypothetical protein HN51_009168 [Arachis hypogaea]|uniref:TORTIFOLIA1/SINE1-2 N-terminal domain-containing protein n=1 Tax=Arachis hypogaea TaxID=3818 RepID=A0A445D0K6_ARAHY|nr:TORTIFOLIA1-like protein 3 [Arachis hypogaea]QHO43640.1 uncharacterized protein DS421_5g164410 [Arachis hypogaea]RYR56675.1 hypothetical protein Ahy_A05g022359 [Arachis hypogaea]